MCWPGSADNDTVQEEEEEDEEDEGDMIEKDPFWEPIDGDEGEDGGEDGKEKEDNECEEKEEDEEEEDGERRKYPWEDEGRMSWWHEDGDIEVTGGW